MIRVDFDLRGARVLLAEDHADSAYTLALLLRLAGAEVRHAPDGPAALAAADDFGPTAAVIDVGLPGLDGWEVGRRLRAKFGSSLLLIAVTGFATGEARGRSAAAGFDAHLDKPADFPELAALVARRQAAAEDATPFLGPRHGRPAARE
jgi:CheY-like chemotaxis protein